MKNFFLKGIYGAVGGLFVAVGATMSGYVPAGVDPLVAYAFTVGLSALGTALAGVGKRMMVGISR